MRTLYLGIVIASMAHAVVLDRVAVVVGTDVITEGEVIQQLRLDEFAASEPLDLSPQQRRATAGRMADQQLIRQEMQVAQYHPPAPSEADPMLRTFRQQHFRSDAEYRGALQKYGITEDQLKQYLLWQLTVIRFTDWRFGGAAQPSPAASADREAPGATGQPSAGRADAIQSADRISPAAGDGSRVDQQLDAWLKQARATTKIALKPEAFQ